MLTLSNFEAQVEKAILKRGKDYFEQGAVVEIDETEDRLWQAEVEGTETYEVKVKIKRGDDVSSYSCECLSDADPCKHIIAVLFAIRQALQKKVLQPDKKNASKPSLNGLLQKISAEEYQAFVRDYAKQNKGFQTAFELYFADKDERINVFKRYADLIQKLIRQHTDRGFIDYRNSILLSREVRKLLDTGSSFLAKNNFKDAFLLAKAVLQEMIVVIEGCDDSNGSISDILTSSIMLLEGIAASGNAAIDMKEQVFDFLLAELRQKIYYDYGDFGYDLFEVLKNLAVKLNKSEPLISFMDAWIAKPDEQYSNYRKEYFKKAKISFLQLTGREAEAAKLVQQNMDIVQVRQGEVDKAIKHKDYTLAKELINKGIEIANKQKHPGTVSQWRKELLRVAVLQKDIETIRHHTKYFAFDRGFSGEYYNQWKKTYPLAEWKPLIDDYIKDTITEIVQQQNKENSTYRRNSIPALLRPLAPILIEEQYWEQLLVLLQKEARLDNVQAYHPYLAKKFPEEMLALYITAFERAGDNANDRSAYARLAGDMKTLIKDIPAGKERIQAIAKGLIQKNPRRPAMIEELNKVVKM